MTEEEIKATIQEIHDSVYEQGKKDGRAEVIEEVECELLANGFIFTEHALEVWHGIAEQLKEQK